MNLGKVFGNFEREARFIERDLWGKQAFTEVFSNEPEGVLSHKGEALIYILSRYNIGNSSSDIVVVMIPGQSCIIIERVSGLVPGVQGRLLLLDSQHVPTPRSRWTRKTGAREDISSVSKVTKKGGHTERNKCYTFFFSPITSCHVESPGQEYIW